jgi:hypothetical protein
MAVVRWLLAAVLARLLGRLESGRTVRALVIRLLPGIESTFLGGVLGALTSVPGLIILGWLLPRAYRALRARLEARQAASATGMRSGHL